MSLSGTFKETPFSDLLKFYALSKQSAIVRVQLSGSEQPDGVFLFANGNLVGASLEGTDGQEAIRRALRLREGSFTAEAGSWDVEAVSQESLDILPDDAVVPVEEPVPVSRSGAARLAPSGATAATVTGWLPLSAALKGTPVPVAPQPAPEPVYETPEAPAAAAQPPEPAPPPRLEAPLPAREPLPIPPATNRRGVVLVVAGVVILAVLGAVAWQLTRRSAPSTAAVPASAPAPAVRGVFDDSIVLGMVASFTGSNKERGRTMRLGWEMAIAETNEKGGIHGRKLRLVTQDDAYDPSRTLAGMKEVVEGQSAFAIVGNVGTSTSAVAAPYAAQKDAVFFGALSGGDGLRKTPPDRHVFNFRASLAREAEAAIRYLVDVRRIPAKRIAVLSQDDDFGASGKRGAVKALTAYGINPAEILHLSYPRNTADVREAVAKLQARPDAYDAVVMTATYKPAATFVRKAKDAGLDLFYTTVSADSNGVAEELVEAGPQYTEGVLVTQVVPVPTSNATTLMRYRQALEKYAPGEKPGSTSLEAWIGAQIFLEGVKRAGRELDTPRLIAALEGINDWDIGIGGTINFGPTDHQGCDVVWGWLLQPDGSYRQIDLE
jgi:ABC-type branched-subunit amino acid transport system substrate-binding protein